MGTMRFFLSREHLLLLFMPCSVVFIKQTKFALLTWLDVGLEVFLAPFPRARLIESIRDQAAK